MSRTLIAVAIALAFNAPLSAQVERDHGVHVHGRSQVNLAVDASTLELELHAPGMDIVGFEHAPRNDEQRAAIDAAVARLDDAGRWLAFEPANACQIVSASTHTHGYDRSHDSDHDHGDTHESTSNDGSHKHHDHGGGASDDHGHDHGHRHDQEHEHAPEAGHDHAPEAGHDHAHDHEHEHAEFHLRLRADCSRQPGAVQLRLTELFPGIELLRVDLITPEHQDRVELRAGQFRVPLPR